MLTCTEWILKICFFLRDQNLMLQNMLNILNLKENCKILLKRYPFLSKKDWPKCDHLIARQFSQLSGVVNWGSDQYNQYTLSKVHKVTQYQWRSSNNGSIFWRLVPCVMLYLGRKAMLGVNKQQKWGLVKPVGRVNKVDRVVCCLGSSRMAVTPLMLVGKRGRCVRGRWLHRTCDQRILGPLPQPLSSTTSTASSTVIREEGGREYIEVGELGLERECAECSDHRPIIAGPKCLFPPTIPDICC